MATGNGIQPIRSVNKGTLPGFPTFSKSLQTQLFLLDRKNPQLFVLEYVGTHVYCESPQLSGITRKQ